DASVVLSGVGWGVGELRPPEMTDHLALAVKYIEHRHLPSLLVLAEEVAVIHGAGRGEQPQVPPAALLSEGEEARRGGLRGDGEVAPRADMPRGAVELIQQRGAGRARALLQWQQCRFTAGRPRTRSPVASREHEVVDDERVLARREELRQAHLDGHAVGVCGRKEVVLG